MRAALARALELLRGGDVSAARTAKAEIGALGSGGSGNDPPERSPKSPE